MAASTLKIDGARFIVTVDPQRRIIRDGSVLIEGQWMDQVTRGWLIYQITGSAFQLGLATALRGLPLLFFGILAGAVADRSSCKWSFKTACRHAEAWRRGH